MRKHVRSIALAAVAAVAGVVLGMFVIVNSAEARDSSFVGWLEVRTTFGTGSGCTTATGAGDICADDAIEYGAGGEVGPNADGWQNGTNGRLDMVFAGQTNNENLRWDGESASNTITLSTGTGVTAVSGPIHWLDTSTSDNGWSVQNAANQACNTTCTSACVFGMNTGALGNFVACTDATADTCVCAGAN